jgi:heme-degrading monooxygenase HmoA
VIRHVVMFTLASRDDAQRAADVAEARRRLTALVGVVPGLRTISLERDLGRVDGHFDVVLVSDHDDEAALEAYQAHPAHVDASAFIRSVTDDRAGVDFEV